MTENMGEKKVVTINLPVEYITAMKELKIMDQKKSRSEVIRNIVTEFLEEHEAIRSFLVTQNTI